MSRYYNADADLEKVRAALIRYALTFPDVYEDYPFHDDNWTCMRVRSTKRIFAWIFERQGHIWVNVKCDPQWREFWRETYHSVLPAYHMNKKHWNSLIVDGTIPDKETERMIAESYDLCAGKKEQKIKGGRPISFS